MLLILLLGATSNMLIFAFWHTFADGDGYFWLGAFEKQSSTRDVLKLSHSPLIDR